MNNRTRVKGWLLYATLVAAALVAHACALDADEATEARVVVPLRTM